MNIHSYADLFITLVIGMAGIIMGISLGCFLVGGSILVGNWLMKKVLK